MKSSNKGTGDIDLECLSGRHAEFLYEILQDNGIYTYIPETPPSSINSLKDRYEGLEKGSSKKEERWLNYAVYSYSKKRYIGTLQATVQLNKNSILIAYMFDPKVWGEGYAVKALSLMMKKMEADYKGFNYYAYIDTRNERSIKLVRKLGFKCVDYIKNADYFNGSSSDEFVFYKEYQ